VQAAVGCDARTMRWILDVAEPPPPRLRRAWSTPLLRLPASRRYRPPPPPRGFFLLTLVGALRVLEVQLDLDPHGQIGWLWVDGHPLAVVRSRGRWGDRCCGRHCRAIYAVL